MGKGYMGKILWVDLGKGEIRDEEIPEDTYKRFLTGYGIGAKLLYDRIPPGADPLGPENILGFASGLLTGTGAVFTGRFMVCAKSPLTGGWGDANCGGNFSPALKRAGYDAVFFTGVSEKPVYLLLTDEKAELVDAGEVWGKDAIETEQALKDRHSDVKRLQVACIGPAAEKLSLISGISNDGGRYAARSGLGAVMGSKKLKAVAAAGGAKIESDDNERIKQCSKEFGKALNKADFMQKVLSSWVVKFAGKMTRLNPMHAANPGDLWCQILKKYGTMGITAMSAETGDSPVKNWGGAGHIDFPLKQGTKVSDDAVLRYQAKKYGCFSCPIQCGGLMEVKDGQWPLAEEMHKPEYETLCSFGTLCLIDDVHALFKLNDLCNRGGLDSISAGAVLAFAIECAEAGILSKDDLGGLDLGWGKAEGAIKLLEKVIAREGIGDVLADGVKVAAEKIGKGSEKFAVHAGGQELPMHDPKFDPPQGLAYEVEPTPGRHTISSLTWQELINLTRFDKNADKTKQMMSKKELLNPKGKARNSAINSKFMQVVNSSGVCLFGVTCGPKYPLYEYLNAATGWGLTAPQFMEIGERIQTLRQAFNVREGITYKDTRMHARATGEEPLSKGPLANVKLDSETMAREYYDQMGWEFDSGKPLKERLEKLGLDEVIKDLYG
jgi:aldehyde:ferredoxin oxidoreductase